MSKPLAICIEDLNAPAETKFIQCVALPGRQPGLRLDQTGGVLWQNNATACELWVSVDERLMLYRQAGMGPVTLHRAGRTLAVPIEKPVVVLDQDQIEVGPQRLSVHIHGEARSIAAPAVLPAPTQAHGHLSLAARTAIALGAVATTVSCFGTCTSNGPTFDVRDAPPAAAPAADNLSKSSPITITLPATDSSQR